MCEHSISMLSGTADGIMCRGCGRLFKDFEELNAEKAPETLKPAPKKAAKKEAAKK